jgi:FeS assembly SUF system protein
MNTPLSLSERVTEILQDIYDPEIPVNIYDLGLIYSLKAEENGEVHIQMTLTSPACPVAETFPQTVQDRVLAVEGVTQVSVELVWDPTWTKDRMSEVAKLQLNMF